MVEKTLALAERLDSIERFLDQMAKSYAIRLNQARKIRDQVRVIRQQQVER